MQSTARCGACMCGSPGTSQCQRYWRFALLASAKKLDEVKMVKSGYRPITLPENKREAYSKGFEAALRRQAGL